MRKNNFDPKKIFYVYFYVNPIDGCIFYVGKGQGNRCYHHLHETDENTENKYKHAVIKGIRAKGFEPIVFVRHENLFNIHALRIEAMYIKRFGKLIDETGFLTNILDDGFSVPDNTGRICSDVTKERIRITKIGRLNPNWGKIYTKEQVQAISERMTGIKHPLFGSRFQWFNNGEKNIRLPLIDEIPFGFVRGMIVWNPKPGFNIKDQISKITTPRFDIGTYMRGRKMEKESCIRMSKSKKNVKKSEQHKKNLSDSNILARLEKSGKVGYTVNNGVTERWIRFDEKMPNGCVKGSIKRNKFLNELITN